MCVIDAPAKLELQTWSFPSITTPHDPQAPPPWNGEPGAGVPSGRSMEMLPMERLLINQSNRTRCISLMRPVSFRSSNLSFVSRLSPSPAVFVTHPPVIQAGWKYSLQVGIAEKEWLSTARAMPPRDRVTDCAGDPDPVLLIDRQMEGAVQFARTVFVGLGVG